MFNKSNDYTSVVMAYFSCNERMAKTIIDSSKANGEFESIKRLCKNQEERRNNHG